MRISDWSSDVCSSDLDPLADGLEVREHAAQPALVDVRYADLLGVGLDRILGLLLRADEQDRSPVGDEVADVGVGGLDAAEGLLEVVDVDAAALTEDEPLRSEEHTSELQSLMRNSYAVFCLKK